MVAGLKVAYMRTRQKKTRAICDGGGVEGRKQENVAEKQQGRYMMVAGLKVANRRTFQKNNNGDM
ncbi:hypothetical protein DPMN_161438 [Dreissena polymorpha]|uniref:Uncharacterized protein n=1 Tax=Dreissena polymorpha TaxID=45954 RepID=A0A9D4IR38_DREPO|nr:hypothetical protein DPMN_161438 [Dreissena polymorpha]